MATPQSRSNSHPLYEPPPSNRHFSAVVNGVHYVWGGDGDNVDYTTINSYDPLTKKWFRRPTSGTPHLGQYSGGCTSIGNELFCFGGWAGFSRCNDMTKINLDTMKWSKLTPNNDPEECPMSKTGCGLVAVDETTLCCFGGFGTGPTQPESTDTNECHLFNTKTSTWSSLDFTGDRPPPCSYFSFIKVDQHRAVLFGGCDLSVNSLSSVYVFDFNRKSITKVEGVQGQPWPVGRSSHSACCLNYGGDHPQLLVFGGLDTNDKTLSDAWLFDVDAGHWTEVPLSVEGRCYYSIRGRDNINTIAITTILRFECPSGGRQWTLVDVADNSTRASRQRLSEKQDKIRQATSAQSVSQHSPVVQLLEQQLRAEREEKRHAQQLLEEANRGRREAEQRAQQLEQRAQQLEQRLLESEQRAQLSEDRAQATQRMLHEANQRYDATERRYTEALRQSNQQLQELRADHDARQARLVQLTTQLGRMRDRAQLAEDRARTLETQWVVDRREIAMTERGLGGGGWGAVRVAKFRGIEVAAKSLHEAIRTDYYRELFIREMNMAARLRHPNLVQFIGATLEREMIILTELMRTSLRIELEQRGLPREHTVSISVQVCQALNYLHLMQPDPVIHRDLSSANVLLNPLPNNCWLAKITDYGSVNTLRALNTENPGSPVYAAPEARSPTQQSTKMDIFSLGVLLIEMVTGRFPNDRDRLLLTIEDEPFSEIIRRCMDLNKDNRPTAQELVHQLGLL